MDKLAQVTPQQLFYIVAAAAAVLLSMGLWDWRTVIVDRLRVRIKRNADDYVTSNGSDDDTATATQPVAATDNEPLRPIAMGRNERNEELSRNVVLRGRAELIAKLLTSERLYIRDTKGNYKHITQGCLIELATGLTPNGRPDSDYGHLRAELEPLLNPHLVVAAGRPEERVISKA